MALSELVILLQPVSAPFIPPLVSNSIVPWPQPNYPAQSLLLFPAVAGGPPAQTNWITPLAVTPWPSPQYQPVAILSLPLPTAPSFVPNLLADTVQPWPSPQYQPLAPPGAPKLEPVTGPFFPAPLAVTPWPSPQYQPQDLLHIPPSAGTAPSTVFAGVKILLRGVKRRKLI